MRSALVALSAAGVIATHASQPTATQTIECDIFVAGGSLAGWVSAMIAANVSKTSKVCYTDITDWVGGQATNGGTSAIDFGLNWAHFPSHLPAFFTDFLTSAPMGGNSTNPGACTVSHACFPPSYFVDWATKRMAEMDNLQVFLNTAVIATGRDTATGLIRNVTLVQRTPVPGTTGWEQRLSAALPDWYSTADSAAFTKQVLFTTPKVVIEGTEFADVLLTSGVATAQGMEMPAENGTVYSEACGQAATFCFWMSYSEMPVPLPDVPPGDDEGVPFGLNAWTGNYSHTLTWRRSWTADPATADVETPYPGDLMLINSLNDLKTSLIFLPLEQAKAQVAAGAWQGGMNLTALRMAEERAYGWFWYLKNASSTYLPQAADYLTINASAAGTGPANMLSKLPYLRETRRGGGGLGGFRLCHFSLASMPADATPDCWEPSLIPGANNSFEGYRFHDTIGIGNYEFDIHWLSNCAPAPYFNQSHFHGAAFFIPFRALTHADSGNLLLAGKTMSQSFWANAATRLHPEEWVSGTAAGAAAALMVTHGWSTGDVYSNIAILQDVLSSPVAYSPLDWVAPPS